MQLFLFFARIYFASVSRTRGAYVFCSISKWKVMSEEEMNSILMFSKCGCNWRFGWVIKTMDNQPRKLVLQFCKNYIFKNRSLWNHLFVQIMWHNIDFVRFIFVVDDADKVNAISFIMQSETFCLEDKLSN